MNVECSRQSVAAHGLQCVVSPRDKGPGSGSPLRLSAAERSQAGLATLGTLIPRV